MFKGVNTQAIYELCVKEGFCKEHSSEINQDENSKIVAEIYRKAVLFIRLNILDPILFKRLVKCDKIALTLRKISHFSQCIAGSIIPVEAYDSIYILDSVVVYTLCYLSRICCIGALFKLKAQVKANVPDIEHLCNLLSADRCKESDMNDLNTFMLKNFPEFDVNLIKLCYASTLIFVRNVCAKFELKAAIQELEKDLNSEENKYNCYLQMANVAYQKENWESALKFYNLAINEAPFVPDLLSRRAEIYITLERYKEAQLDSYIALVIDYCCYKGYKELSSSLYHQNMLKEGLKVADYCLSLKVQDNIFYESLLSFKTEVEIKLSSLKNNEHDNNSKNFINENNEEPNNNFPDLIEPSDSEDTDSEKFPELIDASDSDDVDEMKDRKQINSPCKNKKPGVFKRKRNISQGVVEIKAEEVLDNTKINIYLKEASEAILEDCGFKAVQIFRGPLRNFIESPDSFQIFEECEIVCIKYAYGLAYCKSGEYDDLIKSISIFKEVIEKHETVNFPAAYYTLGLSYRKLNRFRDVLCYLEKVKNVLSKGIYFKVYSWPGTTTAIKETKPEILKDLVDDMINECENPPNPDAICRFQECDSQPTIYYTDPDFKGYMSVYCSEQCSLQYHLPCWRTLKSSKDLTDKEFLEQPCNTPDCEGFIIKIQHIDKKGDVSKEFITESKKVVKSKSSRWEKKAELKEKKKKKTTSKTDDGIPDNNSEGKVNSRKNSLTRRESESSVEYIVTVNTQTKEKPSETIQVNEKPSENAVKQSSIKSSEIAPNVPNSSETVKYEVKYCSSFQPQSANISSTKEQKMNDFKDTYEIFPGTFSGSIKQNSYFSSRHPPKKCNNSNPKESKISEKNTNFVSGSIKRNIYSYMAEFLQLHGPLRVDDPILVNELSTFPDETKQMIEECGGIGGFLKNDLLFAFVGDTYVCVISDLGTAYHLHTKSSLPAEINLQSLENSSSFKLYNRNSNGAKNQSFTLNPDAVEYTPFGSPAINSKGTTYKHLIGTPLFKNTDKMPFVEKKLFGHTLNKSCVSQSTGDLPVKTLLNESKSQRTAESSNLFTTPKLSSSTPLPSTKSSELDSIKEPLLCDSEKTQKTDSEVQNSSLTIAVTSDSSNTNLEPTSESKCENASNNSKSLDNDMSKEYVKEFGDSLSELINLYFSCKMRKHHEAIDSSIKPYAIRKITESKDAGNLAQSNEVSVQNVDIINCDSHALKTENQSLCEQKALLENELSLAKEQEKERLADISNLKMSLEAALSELKSIKAEFKEKEDSLELRKKHFYDAMTLAYETVNAQKKETELVKSEKLSIQQKYNEITSSMQNFVGTVKTKLQAEIKEYTTKIETLEKENGELKNRAKQADLRVLNIMKTEYLRKVEEKTVEASKRRKEVTDGLSLTCGTLNPFFQDGMKILSEQLSSYIHDLNTIKKNFLVKIDKQIDDVKNGSPVNDLEEIEIKNFPEMPSIEKTLAASTPVIDKTLLSSNQPTLTTCLTTAVSAPTSSVLPSSSVVPSVAAIPSVLSTTPFFTPAAPLPTASSLPSCASANLTTKDTKKSEPLLSSDLSNSLGLSIHLPKSLSNSSSSINSYASTPLLSPEWTSGALPFPKNTDNPSTSSVNQVDPPKMPPGMQNPVREFSKAPGTSITGKSLTHANVNSSASNNSSGGLDTIPKVTQQEKKKPSTSSKNSYEKLLSKLHEKFPGYSQEQLISFVKEFRTQKQGKLSGIPMDTIISQIGMLINSSKRANEKKVPTKGLVNKKLVSDPKPKDSSPEPPTVKKKCAWSIIDTTIGKKWSGGDFDDCVICHEDMNNITGYKVPCGHTFHERCIREWLHLKSDCPVCRVLLLLPEDYPSLS